MFRNPVSLSRSLCAFLRTRRACPGSHPGRKDKALALLESTKKTSRRTKGLSTAQWNFKSAPTAGLAECMEHIAAAEDYIRGPSNPGNESPGRSAVTSPPSTPASSQRP